MCGRYTITAPLDELVEVFDVGPVDLEGLRHPDPDRPGLPRFNVAPTQHAPVVVGDATRGRRLGAMRWGLVPHWADDPSRGSRMINARSETARTTPAFRDAFANRRCLIPSDGFYEWMKPAEGPRRPFWIHRRDRRLFAFAGLWERWTPADGEPLLTFTILTARAGPEVRDIHDRMPVILPRDAWDAWGHAGTPVDEVERLLHLPADARLEATEVSTHVNAPRNDDPRCIEPVEDT